jgi:hypothetical protein
MKPVHLSALVLCVLLLVACTTTSHVITGKTRTPIDPSQVKVYSTAPPSYEEIAVIDATTRLSFSSGDQKKIDAVMERLRKEAASLGANGILRQSTGTESGGGVSTGIGTGFGIGGGLSIGTGIFTASDNKTGRGLAIYVPTQSPQ